MTTIYGTITLDDKNKLKGTAAGNHGQLIHRGEILSLTITLKGRKYFKFIEVEYDNKTFYACVPWESTINDFSFYMRDAAGGELCSVRIRYGKGDRDFVYCYESPNLAHLEQFAKQAFYNEILDKLGVGFGSLDPTNDDLFGAAHMDTILEAIRKIKNAGNSATESLVNKIDVLHKENYELKCQLATLEKTNKELVEMKTVTEKMS